MNWSKLVVPAHLWSQIYYYKPRFNFKNATPSWQKYIEKCEWENHVAPLRRCVVTHTHRSIIIICSSMGIRENFHVPTELYTHAVAGAGMSLLAVYRYVVETLLYFQNLLRRQLQLSDFETIIAAVACTSTKLANYTFRKFKFRRNEKWGNFSRQRWYE